MKKLIIAVMDVTEVKFKNPLLLPNIYTIKQKTKTVLHLKKANTIFKEKKKKKVQIADRQPKRHLATATRNVNLWCKRQTRNTNLKSVFSITKETNIQNHAAKNPR